MGLYIGKLWENHGKIPMITGYSWDNDGYFYGIGYTFYKYNGDTWVWIMINSEICY